MPSISLPYGTTEILLNVAHENLKAVLQSELTNYCPTASPEQLVKAALAAPVGTPRLRELAKNKKSIVIISSDHTRPVPSKLLMPALLEEIRMDNPHVRITILVATGCHRPSTQAELLERYGSDIVAREHIIIHDCDAADLCNLGMLPSGNQLWLNRLAAEAELLIAEGFIEPHFFAGYSGGRKAVLPGISGRSTILHNHCYANIDHKHARSGLLHKNPIHDDMCNAAQKVRLAFILNVCINERKEVVAAFSGHYLQAHQQGVRFLESLCQCNAQPADIIVATNGGAPLDQNIYQCVKGMSTAALACKKGGVIILAARCEDGHGGIHFYNTFALQRDKHTILQTIGGRAAEETVPDQWQAQVFLRILLDHTVIMVSDAPREMVEALHMEWAPNIDAALEKAFSLMGTTATVSVIPDAVSVIIK